MGAKMKKSIWIALAILLALQVNFPPELAARGGHGGYRGHRGHVGVNLWLGPGLFAPYYPYYPSYPYYGSYPYYEAPPVIIERQPQEYIVQPDPVPEEPAYWYYCQDPKGYYPYVKRCPSGWMKVVPSPPSTEREER